MSKHAALLAVFPPLLIVSSMCVLGQANASELSSATALIKAGRYREAHQLLSAALTHTNSDPRIWTLDGLALARIGRDKEALTSYESALLLSPEYLPALEGAGELKFKARSADAAEVLRKVIAIRPADQITHAMLATISFEHRDCKTAEAEFQESEQLISSRPVALEQRGACLIQLKRPDDAVTAFEKVTKLRPGDPHAFYNLAFSQLQAGHPHDAIATLKSLPPSALDADTLDLLSDAYEATSDTPAAVATLRDAIVEHPGDARLYLHFANLCMAHKSFPAGVEMLNAGIARSPDAASLYLARGILEAQLAHYSAAEDDFSKAETLDPKATYGPALQDMTKLQQDQLRPATEDLRKRIEKQPKDAFLHYLLAETLARSGATRGTAEFAEAIQAAKTAVGLQPNFGLARDVLGRLYLQQGDMNGAIEQSKLAFAADPNDVTALYHLIQALRKTGETHDLPALAKQLADLRQKAQKEEMEQRRFTIVTHSAANQDRQAH